MAYTLTALRTDIKNKLDDDDFDNTKLTSFINDAIREIANRYRLPHFETTDLTKTVDQGEYTITLPTAAQRIVVLQIISPEDVEVDLTPYYMPYTKFRRHYVQQDSESENRPWTWTLYGNTIEFPYPSDQTYTFKIDYISRPTELSSDSDVPDLTEDFREVIVLGAYIRALEHNDDNDIAQYQRNNNFEPQLIDVVSKYHPQQIGKQRVMRNSYRGV